MKLVRQINKQPNVLDNHKLNKKIKKKNQSFHGIKYIFIKAVAIFLIKSSIDKVTASLKIISVLV